MGHLFRQYDKESVKMGILMHEKIFKQQVYELHRLYRIQKVLMKDITRAASHEQISSICSSGDKRIHKELHHHIGNKGQQKRIDLELRAEEYTEDETEVERFQTGDEIRIELTLGWGKPTQATQVSDPGSSFSSSSANSRITERRDIKGSPKVVTGETLKEFHKWGINDRLGIRTNLHAGNESCMVEEHGGQARVNPQPWQHQILSLNTS